MFKVFAWRALPLVLVLVTGTSRLAFADNATALTGSSDGSTTSLTAASTTSIPLSSDNDSAQWTAYGFNITAPSSMWPMLELLHKYHFDWELYSAQQRPTPMVWGMLPHGVYGQYSPKLNVVRMSYVLQNESVELGAAFLAHELTHLTDDLNGKLGDMTGDVCYAAETRAFVNEANFWEMVNGPDGKTTSDALETQENTKMFAFVGNSHFADLVLRTTSSYIRQCGR